MVIALLQELVVIADCVFELLRVTTLHERTDAEEEQLEVETVSQVLLEYLHVLKLVIGEISVLFAHVLIGESKLEAPERSREKVAHDEDCGHDWGDKATNTGYRINKL